MRRHSLVLFAFSLCGCEDDVVVTIDVTTGYETDAFSKAPAVTSVEVALHDESDTVVLSTTSTPGGSFELGELSIDQFVSLSVSGRDASGTERASGRSLGLVLGALQGEVLPVFAARLGEWSRPPDALPHGRGFGLAAVVGERYLMLAGGEVVPESAAGPNDAAFYDLLALGGSQGTAPLPRSPRAMVVTSDGVALLLIDDEGASVLELDSGVSTELALPTGLDGYGELAGGLAVTAAAGASYLVGAARLDQTSDAVLHLGTDRAVSLARLASARRGAAAVWIDGAGLLVAGGSADAPGVELLLDGGEQAQSLPFPPDASEGAALVARASGGAVLLGGIAGGAEAPLRLLDPACASDCQPEPLDFAVGVALTGCRAFPLGGDRYLLAGSDDSGMRTFIVDLAAQSADELPLREARTGASVTPTPTGAFALLGGQHDDGSAATTVELLRP